jgi:hypothetical protein
MKTKGRWILLTVLALFPGCGSVRNRRMARREQAELDGIARIQDPQRRLQAAAHVLVETGGGGNIHIAQEILNRYPNLVNQPYWDRTKTNAENRAMNNGHQDIVALLARYDSYRRQPPVPPARPAIPVPSPPPAAAPPAAAILKSDVDNPSYHESFRDEDFALVIGVEKYEKIPDARFAERDAEAVKRHLLALGFPQRNVISLTGQAATRGAIQGYVEEWLPKNVKPGSTVFIYYSGHGAPEPTTGEAYLVPWDGDPRFLQSTAYPIKQLYDHLGKLKAKSTIVALDSCFSGAGGRSVLAEGVRPLVVKYDDGGAASSALTILTASGGDEITSTLSDQGHGLFTYFLLKGLTKGKRDAKDLYNFIKPRVQDEANRQNRQQTPALLGVDSSF